MTVTPESPSVEQFVADIRRAADIVAISIEQMLSPSSTEAGRRTSLALRLIDATGWYPLQQAELGRLREERSEDAARLDWLERMAHDGEQIGDIGIGGSWERQSVTVGDPVLTGIQGSGATVREAIDNARSALSGEER